MSEKINKPMRKVDVRLLFHPLSLLLFSFLLVGCAETALVVHTAKEIAKLVNLPSRKGDIRSELLIKLKMYGIIQKLITNMTKLALLLGMAQIFTKNDS